MEDEAERAAPPPRTTLTPWRIGAADQPRAERTGRSRVVNDERLAAADGGRRGPRLGPGPLLDDDELAAGVVDAGPSRPTTTCSGNTSSP